MKIKEGYILRKVADSCMVIPVGREASKRRSVLALNETGGRIWEELEQGRSPEEITDRLMEEYDIPQEELQQNIKEFMELLWEQELLE